MMTFRAPPAFRPLLGCGLLALGAIATPSSAADLVATVKANLDSDYPSLEKIYQHLHAHPELSFMEVETSALVARELTALGFEVTEHVGNTGVVGVLHNGAGPTIMVRADMDALPMAEKTGLPFAPSGLVKDMTGKETPAMHACAHDSHVTALIGTARQLTALKDQWSGTLVFVGQPAEEIGAGAVAMLRDGLFTRFPKPDYVLGLHTWAAVPAGVIGYTPGPMLANVNSVDILVPGIGGHGSRPHTTKDPVVLASEIVIALQTIVSREIKPGEPAVVTVGTIHGGTKRNIISEEVKLELTLRSYSDDVAQHLIASVKRISENLGRAAGLPEDHLPVVTTSETSTPVTRNDPDLTARLAATFTRWLGTDAVHRTEPVTAGEDFSNYGRTAEKIPACFWFVGGGDPAVLDAAARNGTAPPSNHSPVFAPVAEPTIKAAITSMTAAVLDLASRP